MSYVVYIIVKDQVINNIRASGASKKMQIILKKIVLKRFCYVKFTAAMCYVKSVVAMWYLKIFLVLCAMWIKLVTAMCYVP